MNDFDKYNKKARAVGKGIYKCMSKKKQSKATNLQKKFQ